MVDIKMIEDSKFVPKKQIFKPRETFKFIKDMFEPQLKIQDINFSLHIGIRSNQRLDANDLMYGYEYLPESLYGDQIRLK